MSRMTPDIAQRKINLRRGRGDRTDKEKQIGNDYFGCDYL